MTPRPLPRIQHSAQPQSLEAVLEVPGEGRGHGLSTSLMALLGRCVPAAPVERQDGSVEVRPTDAPRLFAMIADLARRLGAAPPDRVVLTPDPGATIEDCAEVGLFNEYSTELRIGAPLIATGTEGALATAIVRELGHRVGRNGQLEESVGRSLAIWEPVLEDAPVSGRRGPLQWTRAAFARWYVPRMQRRSSALTTLHDQQMRGAIRSAVRVLPKRRRAEPARALFGPRWKTYAVEVSEIAECQIDVMRAA